MRLQTNRRGFTLLEIIIVIIIIGVLASLALPRLFSTVEYARSTEALAAISTIRSSLERCYLQNNATYTGCDMVTGTATNTLDIPDPNSSPNAHFEYHVAGNGGDYIIRARRNGVDNGSDDGTDLVGLQLSSGTLTKAGKGAYKAIGNSTSADWLTGTW